jgi:hypothetical protein
MKTLNQIVNENFESGALSTKISLPEDDEPRKFCEDKVSELKKLIEEIIGEDEKLEDYKEEIEVEKKVWGITCRTTEEWITRRNFLREEQRQKLNEIL